MKNEYLKELSLDDLHNKDNLWDLVFTVLKVKYLKKEIDLHAKL